jgi:uncharacterized protein YfiM (DUF2279 family)
MHGLMLVLTLHVGRDDHPAGDRWFAVDKAKHFATSAFVQSVAFSGLRVVGVGRMGALVGATAVTSAVSVGKEVHDRRSGGHVSGKDLAWDAAGLLAASLLLHRTER